MSFGFFGDKEVFGWETEPLTCFVREVGSAFTVGFGGPGDLRNTASDFGLCDDDFGFAVVVIFGVLDGGEDGVEVVSVDGLSVPVQ